MQKSSDAKLALKIVAIEEKVIQAGNFYVSDRQGKSNVSGNDEVASVDKSSVSFDNFSIKIDVDNLDDHQKSLLTRMSDEELYKYVEDLYIDAYSQFNEFFKDWDTHFKSSSIFGLSGAVTIRNNDVWTAIPLVTNEYIRVRYSASYHNNQFLNGAYTNSWFSGDSGIMVGGYDQQHGVIEFIDNKTTAKVYTKGTLTYEIVVKGLPTLVTVDVALLYFDDKPY